MNPEFENWANYILCQPRVVRRWLRYPIHKKDATASLKTLLGEIASCPVEFCIFPDFVTFFRSSHVALRIPLCELSESDRAGIEDLRRNASKIFKTVEKLNVSRKIICREFMYNDQFAIWRYDVIKACCIALLTSAHKRGILIPTAIVLKGALLHSKLEKMAIRELPKIALGVMGIFEPKLVATLQAGRTVNLLEHSSSVNDSSVQNFFPDFESASESSVQNSSLANFKSASGSSVQKLSPDASGSSVQNIVEELEEEEAHFETESLLPAMCEVCGGAVQKRFVPDPDSDDTRFKQKLLNAYVEKYFGNESAADKARWKVLFLAYAADRLNMAIFVRRKGRWVLDAFEAFTNGEPVDSKPVLEEKKKDSDVKSSWYMEKLVLRDGSLKLVVIERSSPWTRDPLTDERFLFGGLDIQKMNHPDPENACGGEVGFGWWAGEESLMVTPEQWDYQAALVIAFLAGRPMGYADGTFYSLSTAMRWLARYGDPILAWFSFVMGFLPACHDDRRAMVQNGPPDRCRDRKNWEALVDACDAYIYVDKVDASHPAQVVFRAIVNFVSPDSGVMFSTSFEPGTVRLVNLEGKSRAKNKLLPPVVKLQGAADIEAYWKRLLNEKHVEGMATLVTYAERNTEIEFGSVFAPFGSWMGCFASHFNQKFNTDYKNFVPVEYDLFEASGHTTLFGDALYILEIVAWAREPVESIDALLLGKRVAPIRHIQNLPLSKDITIDDVKLVRDPNLVGQEKMMDFPPIPVRHLAYSPCECECPDKDFDQRLVPYGFDKQKDQELEDFVRDGHYGGQLPEPRFLTDEERQALFDGIANSDTFKCLIPGMMLKGTVIDLYRNYLLKMLEKLSCGKKKVHIFHTAFFNTNEKNRIAVPRGNVDLFALDHVFFLLHSVESKHFFLAHVDMQSKPKRLKFYDSFGNHEDYEERADVIRTYLAAHHMAKKKIPLSFSGWKFEKKPERIRDYMQTTEGNDCGCWMLRTVEHIVMGWPLEEVGIRMDDYRAHIYKTIAPMISDE